MAFRLSSPAFDDGSVIPERHTCMGEDISPPLAWQDPPPATKSFALICRDPDAPRGTFHHWGICNIPAGQHQLPEAVASNAEDATALPHAINDFGRSGFAGPCPPKGHGVHHYHFRLMALDVERLDLASGASCSDLVEAAEPHLIASAELVGLFQR